MSLRQAPNSSTSSFAGLSCARSEYSRALTIIAVALGVALTQSRVAAQTPAVADPELQGLSADEFTALRPLALRGAAILVRDGDQGARARITILVRARASLETVRTVVASPEQYTTFMPTLQSVEIVSRHATHIAFRFHVSAVMFDVVTLSALHVVSPRRVDVAIVQSDIGPGASRWDLMPDGDGTLIALSTWGDPSRGAWFLRQLAQRAPNAIAGMNISADMILALGLSRRSEILSGRQIAVRPVLREAPSGPLEPPVPGPWMALTHACAIGSIALTDEGVLTQTTVAMWSPIATETLQQRLTDVEHYPQFWTSMRDVSVLSHQGDTVRYRSTIHSALSETRGEQERTATMTPTGSTVTWHGVAGDYLGTDHRWDLVRDPSGGTVTMFTGGSEINHAGFMTRSMMDRDVWLVPGYAASYKLVWMRPLLVNPMTTSGP